MEPNRVEFQKQCIFQSFCKRVLHNEACNAHEEIRRRRAKEVSFSDLALHEERQLYTLDKYFQDEEAEPSYQQAGKKITPKLLLEAIRTLPEEKRKAIILFLILSDKSPNCSKNNSSSFVHSYSISPTISVGTGMYLGFAKKPLANKRSAFKHIFCPPLTYYFLLRNTFGLKKSPLLNENKKV